MDKLNFDDVPEVEVVKEPLTLSDFSIEDVTPEPLVSDGVYKGHIVDTALSQDAGYVRWKVSLQGNEGLVCNDGVTSVDGVQLEYLLWLPILGDEAKKSKFSALTEKQVRTNGVIKFCKDMQLELHDPKKVVDSLTHGVNNRTWIGMPVVVTAKNEAGKKAYAGKMFTRIKKMEKGL